MLLFQVLQMAFFQLLWQNPFSRPSSVISIGLLLLPLLPIALCYIMAMCVNLAIYYCIILHGVYAAKHSDSWDHHRLQLALVYSKGLRRSPDPCEGSTGCSYLQESTWTAVPFATSRWQLRCKETRSALGKCKRQCGFKTPQGPNDPASCNNSLSEIPGSLQRMGPNSKSWCTQQNPERCYSL